MMSHRHRWIGEKNRHNSCIISCWGRRWVVPHSPMYKLLRTQDRWKGAKETDSVCLGHGTRREVDFTRFLLQFEFRTIWIYYLFKKGTYNILRLSYLLLKIGRLHIKSRLLTFSSPQTFIVATPPLQVLKLVTLGVWQSHVTCMLEKLQNAFTCWLAICI